MPSRHNLSQPHSPPTTTTTQFVVVHHHHHNPQLLRPLAAGGGGAVLSIFLLILVLCRKLTRHRTAPSDSNKPPHRLSYSLLRRATASFASQNLLGRGGFGSVYKGVHPSLNHIAVKVMDAGSLQGEREFQNELFFAQKINQSANVVAAIGFSYNRRRRRILLVYDLMQNGNLQDALLHRKCAELMEWEKRFSIAIDIAKGIEYLHHAFDPPIIHGDIKPSNILLDQSFAAKIGDFGLARLKSESLGEVSVEMSGVGGVEGTKKEKRKKKRSEEVESETNCGVDDCEETESVVITGLEEFHHVGLDQSPECLGLARVEATNAMAVSPETMEVTLASPEMVEVVTADELERVAVEAAAGAGAVASPSTAVSDGNFDKGSVDSDMEMVSGGRKGSGRGKRSVSRRDWWWKQENGDGDVGDVKDYVMDWIGTEIRKERPKSSWIGTSSNSAAITKGKSERKKKNRKRLDWWRKNGKRLEWWASLDDEKGAKKDKRRPAREWWKEEFCEELARKKKKKKAKKNKHNQTGFDHDYTNDDNSWPKDEDLYSVDRKKKKGRSRSKSRSSMGSMDWWLDGLSGELWRARHTSLDSVSGEIPKSGGIGSTPSMRGTVCYIAPEYGGGGYVSEKCDVYSYGVLLLVLVAGRRPLQVTGSPMSEFQRANLISWARHLARSGKLLDLVDHSIQSLDQEQALLCLTVALLCLQKFPARRPSMKEVVGMLCGDVERPQLPVEFSPSPPSRFPLKSQKKVR